MSTATQPTANLSPPANLTAAAAAALAPAKASEYNRLNLDYRRPMPRPKVNGIVVDFHTHLIAARHAKAWFEAADHFGFDAYVTMSPLEEVLGLQRDWPGKIQFITVPAWQNPSVDDWLRRLEMFYNLGSRIIKFHMAPGTMAARNIRLDSPPVRAVMREAAGRGMILMSHIGDPDLWYEKKYSDRAKFGTRQEHYAMWEAALEEYRSHPWLGAHLGGNPENLPRLQSLLDRFPNLYLDNSATRWMVRELSLRRDAAREFFIRNADRILFGTDQVSGDDRGFDFLASRIWAHRKMWETAYHGPSPILDADFPENEQPIMRGLALPDDVLQKLYHDNAEKLLARVGVRLGEV
jgi:predicted TIM-barrel fold metal-dependent hydrolase